jgi:hypothetical protein
MNAMAEIQHRRFDTFNAVYCSGFFIDDSALLTALCLVFDQVHIPNHFQYVIEYAEQFLKQWPEGQGPFDPESMKMFWDGAWQPYAPPIAAVTPAQREAWANYVVRTRTFWKANRALFGTILHSELFPAGSESAALLSVEVSADHTDDRFSVMVSHADKEAEIASLLDMGAAPVFGVIDSTLRSNATPSVAGAASLLALRSVELALPRTISAHPEVILEARERLKDHLPPFWAYMLRLSTEFRAQLDTGMALKDVERECRDYVDATVRPALLEANHKMMSEYKSWFHKIITPVADGLKVALGKPNLSVADLIIVGLQMTGNISGNLLGTRDATQQTGLTYLLKLKKEGAKL